MSYGSSCKAHSSNALLLRTCPCPTTHIDLLVTWGGHSQNATLVSRIHLHCGRMIPCAWPPSGLIQAVHQTSHANQTEQHKVSRRKNVTHCRKALIIRFIKNHLIAAVATYTFVQTQKVVTIPSKNLVDACSTWATLEPEG